MHQHTLLTKVIKLVRLRFYHQRLHGSHNKIWVAGLKCTCRLRLSDTLQKAFPAPGCLATPDGKVRRSNEVRTADVWSVSRPTPASDQWSARSRCAISISVNAAQKQRRKHMSKCTWCEYMTQTLSVDLPTACDSKVPQTWRRRWTFADGSGSLVSGTERHQQSRYSSSNTQTQHKTDDVRKHRRAA